MGIDLKDLAKVMEGEIFKRIISLPDHGELAGKLIEVVGKACQEGCGATGDDVITPLQRESCVLALLQTAMVLVQGLPTKSDKKPEKEWLN